MSVSYICKHKRVLTISMAWPLKNVLKLKYYLPYPPKQDKAIKIVIMKTYGSLSGS